MPCHRIAAALVGLSVVVVGAAAIARAADGQGKAATTAPTDDGKVGAKDQGDGKARKKQNEEKQNKELSCMHCGATCGLEPVCVCEPSTKKQPKVEFEVSCEPICVAGCGSKPWPLGGWHGRSGCTSCCAEPCACRGWVKHRQTLERQSTDEEIPTIKRSVAYVCAGCCAEPRKPRPASWWSVLTAWCR